MRRLIKWAGWVFVALVLLLVAVGAGTYGLLRQTVAPVNGEVQVSGLGSDVSVHKDMHAIPHIEGDSRADALEALGWLHASERMWQMEVLRMASQGRLSEMFGEKTVSSDRFLKTLDLAGYSQSAFEILRDDTKLYLEAYARGVNAWLNRKTGTFEPRLPVEFIVLGHKPDAWEAWQSVAILKVMALTLDANMDEEIGRLALASKGFNPRQIEEVYPAGPRDNPPLLPDLKQLYGFGNNGKVAGQAGLEPSNEAVPLATAPWQLQLPASNNWAIAGSKTVSGKPLLANDPHLALTAPSTFYLAHLRWRDGEGFKNLVGGTLPGTPFVLSGRNDALAWGLTTTYLDSQDLFLEQVLPDDPSRYRTENGSLPFLEKEVTIKVSGGEDITFTRRETRHGPVLPDGYKKLRERLPEGHVAALSWTALDRNDTTVDGVFDIGVAESVDVFFEKTRSMKSPMQSIVVADASGKIGIIAPAHVPVRSKFNRLAGRAPALGWMKKYAWLDALPHDQLPMIKNPLSGVVGSANSNWLPANYQHHITYDWAEPFRQERIEQLYIATNNKQSVETMVDGQSDTLSLGLMRFRDAALDDMPQGVRLNEEIQSALEQWDGRMEMERPEPLILVAWHRNLLDLMLRDDLGDDFELVEAGRLSRVLSMLIGSGARNWCNRSETPQVETCGEILFEAAELALGELRSKYGENWKSWKWGDANLTFHEHRPFSQVGLLSPYFTIRQKMDGGKYTLLRNSNDFSKDEPYAGRHGSALRAIHDFADLEKSLYMISTGQSGNILSSHYKDLAPKWGRLEYVQIPTDPAKYRSESVGVLILKSEAR